MSLPRALETDISFPRFYRVEQQFSAEHIDDIDGAVESAMAAAMPNSGIGGGDRVAVGIGSRDIAGIDVMVRAVCRHLIHAGAEPVIVPGMGSHGGATAAGQRHILESLGITADSCRASVADSMDTEVIAKVFGEVPVHFSREALRADHTVIINRIKPHTKFKGPVESGLMKMLCVGLGKHRGALAWHRWAMIHGYHPLLDAMGRAVLENANVRFGIGVVENASHRPMHIEAVPAGTIPEREPDLLQLANAHFPRLPFRKLDVLLVGESGKDISGAGMDPNVTGRALDLNEEGFSDILDVKRIGLLGLTAKTGGNGLGIGTADFITDAVYHRLDPDITRTNAITSLSLRKAFIPIRLPSAAMLMNMCFATLGPVAPASVCAAIIRNTRDLDIFWASEALVEELQNLSHVSVGSPLSLGFDDRGDLREPELIPAIGD